ncbi:MAG: nidogen-like domain-containing protein [Sandaracinaceae bacterium]
MRKSAFIGLLTLLVGIPSAVSAQGELMTGLGGEAGFGEGHLDYNDDGSTSEIDMRSAFPNGLEYFGQRFHTVFVNNNGSVTFGGATGTFTPQRFPVSGNRMIAPFWADVDTRGGGRPSRNGVYYDLSPGQMVVTWHNVGFYPNDNSRENSFQLIIMSNPTLDEDNLWKVQFRYNRCEWTTGGASGGSGGLGGSPAQAGFDAGNGSTYEILPGSGTQSVLNLCSTSNVGVNGIWEFDIYLGRPQMSLPTDGQVETIDYSHGAGGGSGGRRGGHAAPPRRRRH